MKSTRLNGQNVSADTHDSLWNDPGLRTGDALIETMRARNGVIFCRHAHLERMCSSAQVLGYRPGLDRDALETDLDEALADTQGDMRVRACVSADGLRWVETAPTSPPSPAPKTTTATVVEGGWVPSWWIAEHKTVSRAHLAYAERRARQMGYPTALLADVSGRLGEASTASVFVVHDDDVLTAPPRGLLPGIGRRVLLQEMPEIIVRAARREEWSAAGEIFTVSAFAGVTAVTAINEMNVGDGEVGPVTRRAAMLLAAQVRAAWSDSAPST